MVPGRVSLVTLGVRDLAAMRAFYRDLGWSEAISTEVFAAFNTGGAVLALFPLDALASDANTEAATGEDAFKGVTLAVNVEEKKGVDEAIDKVRGAGGGVVKGPIAADWGGRSGSFSGPGGDRLEGG